MSKVIEFEKAIKEFGVDAALEYFDVPEEKKDFFRNEINKNKNKCRFCGEPCIIDGGICYDCHLSTR
jgi:hypothetical protein